METLYIFSGRFQPPTPGHRKVYTTLAALGGDVRIATTGKVNPDISPFSFEEKVELFERLGVSRHVLVRTTDPYNVTEIGFDPEKTILIYVVSDKDAARFKRWSKIDGEPTYLQPLADAPEALQSADKHAYVQYMPVIGYGSLGWSSATEVRDAFRLAHCEATRRDILRQIYGTYDDELYNLFMRRLVK